MNRRIRRRRGFTLMEILLVLAILVVLGSMVTLGYSQIQKSANVKLARSQIHVLEEAVELYRLDVGTYPKQDVGLGALMQNPGDLAVPEKWAGPYLKQQTLPVDPWNNPYSYEIVGEDQNSNVQIRIWSNGPNGTSGDNDDVSTAL